MLPYAVPLTERFAIDHGPWIRRELTDYHLPAAAAPPGELDTLQTFSREWTDYAWKESAYWATNPKNLLASMRYALGTERRPLAGKLVLEVGMGVGGIASLLAENEGCETVGMDLSYSVDQAMAAFRANSSLHIVQGSLFFPPFRAATFDLVYSQGVLHHTYSTEAAFASIARLPRTQGWLYVWLYSHQQEGATPLRRILMRIEKIVRPRLTAMPDRLQTIALAPTIPVYLAYQNVYRRWRHGETAAKYGFREAYHAARDRLTPPFAFRHSYEEVMNWFAEQGYGNLELLRNETPPPEVLATFWINVGIRGQRLVPTH